MYIYNNMDALERILLRSHFVSVFVQVNHDQGFPLSKTQKAAKRREKILNCIREYF